ncbi:MAG: sugar ABC transporter permease [Acidimicrobiia bacterium]
MSDVAATADREASLEAVRQSLGTRLRSGGGRMRSRKAREAWLGFFFVLPALTVFAVFIFYPFVRNFWLGFHKSNPFTGASRWVGWSQWVDKLQLDSVPSSIAAAIPWAVGFTAIALGIRVWRRRHAATRFARSDVRFAVTTGLTLLALVSLWEYSYQWNDPKDFTHALHVTFLLTLYAMPAAILGGLLLAVLLHERLRGVPIFRLSYSIPIVAGPGVAGVMFVKFFNPEVGLLPWLLDKHDGLVHLMDLSQSPLENPKLALPAVALVMVWMNIGLAFIIMSAGLQGVPDHLYEAAKVDGAGAWSRFWRVTVPMMSPTLFFATVMGTIIVMVQSFGVIEVLTQGGPHPYETTTTVPVLIVHLVNSSNPNLNLAGIYSVGLFLVTMGLTLFQVRVLERWVTYER